MSEISAENPYYCEFEHKTEGEGISSLTVTLMPTNKVVDYIYYEDLDTMLRQLPVDKQQWEDFAHKKNCLAFGRTFPSRDELNGQMNKELKKVGFGGIIIKSLFLAQLEDRRVKLANEVQRTTHKLRSVEAAIEIRRHWVVDPEGTLDQVLQEKEDRYSKSLLISVN